MKKIVRDNRIYLPMLLLVSLIISSNLYYDKIYYVQILVSLILSVIAVVIRQINLSGHHLKVYFIGFIILAFFTLSLYDRYEKYNPIYEPFFAVPKEPVYDYDFGSYANRYYENNDFRGIISTYNFNDVSVFDVNQKQSYEIHVPEMTDYEYLNGRLYVTSYTRGEMNTDISVIDIYTKEVLETISNPGYYELTKLGNKVYLTRDNELFDLSYTLDTSDSITISTESYYGELDAYEWRGFYFISRQLETNGPFELSVYDEEFNYMKQLVTSSNPIMLSTDQEDTLYISVSEIENDIRNFYFYIYEDTDLSLERKQLISKGSTDRDRTYSLQQYGDYYFVTELSLGENLEYQQGKLSVYDDTFDLIHYDYNNRYHLHVVDDTIYLQDRIKDAIYLLNKDNIIVPPFNFTFLTPFKNLLFVVALFIYPVFLINLTKEQQKNG